ncbi:hypothetical protein MDOR_35390 [Mycolicibacterium doricum]|uniref:Uncharacterized protein n=1 Tax=Mycolicibacterium doricum TaxID=126673 RepID=A0A7I7VWT0_9MYCO|nr:hypothetical protein MDOR_35390 [Mycolicibacterium doricum]
MKRMAGRKREHCIRRSDEPISPEDACPPNWTLQDRPESRCPLVPPLGKRGLHRTAGNSDRGRECQGRQERRAAGWVVGELTIHGKLCVVAPTPLKLKRSLADRERTWRVQRGLY